MACHRRTLSGRRNLLAPAAAFPERYPCLLESVVRGTPQARYDILFAFPQGCLTLHADGRLSDAEGERDGRFLGALDADWQRARLPVNDDELPFHGGWAVWLAYELAGEIKPSLCLQRSGMLPVALALRCPAAIIIDHQRDCTVLIAEAGHAGWLDQLEADLAAVTDTAPLPAPTSLDEDAPQGCLDSVARIHEHLHAGDIFKVNLSRAWRARYAQPPVPAALYARCVGRIRRHSRACCSSRAGR